MITLETNFACAYKRLSGLVNFSAKTHPECEHKGNTIPQTRDMNSRTTERSETRHSSFTAASSSSCLVFPRWDGPDLKLSNTKPSFLKLHLQSYFLTATRQVTDSKYRKHSMPTNRKGTRYHLEGATEDTGR